MITCPRCGYQAPDGTPWCPRCGYGRSNPMQPPTPPAPQKTKKKKFPAWLIVVIIIAGIIIIGVGAFAVSSVNKSANKLAEIPTSSPVDMEATARAMLLQKSMETMTAGQSDNSDTSEQAATPTPKAKMPDYCGDDFRMELIRMAEVLDADGFPYPEEYLESNNMCLYRIVDDKSFLNMDSFGYLYLYFDENNQLYMAHLEIPYKDNDQIREVIRDWGAVAISALDKTENILTAQSAAEIAIASGSVETQNCEATGQLHTDKMIYRIVVRDKSIL